MTHNLAISPDRWMNLPATAVATAQVPQAPSGAAKGTITLRNRVNKRVFIEM